MQLYVRTCNESVAMNSIPSIELLLAQGARELSFSLNGLVDLLDVPPAGGSVRERLFAHWAGVVDDLGR